MKAFNFEPRRTFAFRAALLAFDCDCASLATCIHIRDESRLTATEARAFVAWAARENRPFRLLAL